LLAIHAGGVFARGMDTTKPWYSSKTIWASLIGAIATVLGLFHVEVADFVTPVVESIVTLIMLAIAIYGRVTASAQIAPSNGTTARRVTSLLLAACLSIGAATSLTSCSSTGGLGGVTGAISSAQSWLADPKNQAMIQQIANDALSVATLFGKHAQTTDATVVGKLAQKYPDVPAGAITQIAKNPTAYAKK
jgi:hypothetical protein